MIRRERRRARLTVPEGAWGSSQGRPASAWRVLHRGARDERAAEQAEAEQVQHGQAEALPLRPAVQRDDRGGVLLLVRLPCESAGLASDRPAEGAGRRAAGRAAWRAQPSARRPAAERTEATAGRQGGAEYRRACQHHPALRAAARSSRTGRHRSERSLFAVIADEVDYLSKLLVHCLPLHAATRSLEQQRWRRFANGGGGASAGRASRAPWVGAGERRRRGRPFAARRQQQRRATGTCGHDGAGLRLC